MGRKIILAVDPGRHKNGLALVAQGNAVLHHEIVGSARLLSRVAELLQSYPVFAIVLGNRTGSKEADRQFSLYLQAEQWGIPIIPVEEHRSSEEARQRYWQAQPPRGWRRWIPLGLQVPPVPIDDYAAIILAERYFAQTEG